MSEKLKAYEKEVSHENSNYPSILPGILGRRRKRRGVIKWTFEKPLPV
jgi:hypothetical protein